MRLLLLLIYLSCFFSTNLRGQQHLPASYTKTGAVPEKGIYRFPAFTDGVILMRNGIAANEKMNFNVSLDEMHFIGPNGDTLSVAEPASIRFISLQNSRFYYDKMYLQTIDSAGTVMLAFRQLLSMQQRRPSAYGMTEPHEGVRYYNLYSSNGKTDRIGQDEMVTVTARDVYFFGDAYGRFSKADKAFILGHFSLHQDAIKAFLQAHPTNFNKLTDLSLLLEFCRQLQ